MALSKADILGLNDIEIKEIDVPEWGGSVFIRQLTRGQVDQYFKRRFPKSVSKAGRGMQAQTQSEIELFGHDAWLVAQAVCDADGKRLFTNSEIGALNDKNADVIGRLAVEIAEFSGMAQDIKTLEEQEQEQESAEDLKN